MTKLKNQKTDELAVNHLKQLAQTTQEWWSNALHRTVSLLSCSLRNQGKFLWVILFWFQYHLGLKIRVWFSTARWFSFSKVSLTTAVTRSIFFIRCLYSHDSSCCHPMPWLWYIYPFHIEENVENSKIITILHNYFFISCSKPVELWLNLQVKGRD